MRDRLELHETLVSILGSNHVYYNPPESLKLVYPCIIYNKENFDTRYADNKRYVNHTRYSVTLVNKKGDSSFIDELAELPLCRFDRHFVVDNLHHDVFTIYY